MLTFNCSGYDQNNDHQEWEETIENGHSGFERAAEQFADHFAEWFRNGDSMEVIVESIDNPGQIKIVNVGFAMKAFVR